MKKTLYIALTLLLAVCFLTGCGCGRAQDTTSAQPVETEEPSKAAVPEEPEKQDEPEEVEEEVEIVEEVPVVEEAETEPEVAVDTRTAAQRGLEAIQATGDDKRIQLPKEKSYLEEFKTCYIDFSDVLIPTGFDTAVQMVGPSAPVECQPDMNVGRRMPFAYQGSEVTVVAEQKEGRKNMACILYRSSTNRMRAGWIWDIYLGDEYVGRNLTIGDENNAAVTVEEVPISWSDNGFLRSPQKYSVLEEPVQNCVAFTLEYQLTSPNTYKEQSVLGPRTVYVNNGEEWIEVGSFEYPSLGTVRVRVNLEEPMDIVAIGTIADCLQPNIFNFRQFASEFSTEG